MRFRIAVSAGLAAVIVLSVFTMIKYDSRVAAEGAEIDEFISTGIVPAIAEFSVQQDLITGMNNSQQDDPSDFVMSEPADVGSAIAAQVIEPELEAIYVYPDGSIAPTPSDLLSGSSGEIDYDFDDWDDDYDDDHERHRDDDHDDWDEDHDDERDHDDDDDRDFFVGKLAGGLFSDRDHDDDHSDSDDDDHERDHHDDDDHHQHDDDHDDD